MDISQFTKNGKFLMLALDHQEHFKKIVNPQDPSLATAEQIIQAKQKILQALEDEFTGVLLDTEYGLPAYEGIDKPFILRIERSGFIEINGLKTVELQHTVPELKNKGASGIKFLLAFNPELPACFGELEKARRVLEDCQKNLLPLFLEILTYQNGQQQLLSKGESVLKTLEIFLQKDIVPGVFKIEYPQDKESCQKVSQLLGKTPWILLSGGEDFEEFKTHVEVAIKNGAAGFLAGRAVWQDIPSDTHLLQQRFSDLSKVVLT